MDKKKVLITGGSGFVGTNLVEYCLDLSWEVMNFDIAPPRNPAHEANWLFVDLLDREKVIQETKKFEPDYLLHFGARTDLDENAGLTEYAANIDGVLHVIEAIRSAVSVERAIFASSQLVCDIGYQPRGDWDYQPTTTYGMSKVIGEKLVRAADEFGPSWTIVRPTSLWGPWFDIPYKNFFLTISKNLYAHPGGIKTLKHWGFVGNAIYQVAKLLGAPSGSVHKKTFYLADYEAVLLRDFANHVQKIMNAYPVKTMPLSVLQLVAKAGDMLQFLGWRQPPLTSFRLGNITTCEIQDLVPLQKIVGPLPYSLEAGIQMTVQWLRQRGEL